MLITPPVCERSEKMLLSCVLLDPSIASKIHDNFLYKSENKEMLKLIKSAYKPNVDPFDLAMSITDKYEQKGFSGVYIMEVFGFATTSANYEMHVKTLAEYEKKRACITANLLFTDSIMRNEYDITGMHNLISKIELIDKFIKNSEVDDFLNSGRLADIDTIKQPVQIVENILSQGKIFCIGGASKAGKSLMACRLAMNLSTGGEFFGHKCEKIKVLYFDTELDEDDFKVRQKIVKQNDNLTIILSKKLTKHEGETQLEKIKRYLDIIKQTAMRENIKAVFIDCIYRFICENDIAEVSMLVNALEELKSAGITVIVVHHTKKAMYEGGEVLNQLAGHSNLGRCVDGGLLLMETNTRNEMGKHYRIYYSLRNFKIPAPCVVYIDSDKLEHVIDTEATDKLDKGDKSKKDDPHKSFILSFLPKHQKEPILKSAFVEYMADVLKLSETHVSTRLCFKWEEQGYIKLENKGSKNCTIELGAMLLGEALKDMQKMSDLEDCEELF